MASKACHALVVLLTAVGGCSSPRELPPEAGRRYIQTTALAEASGGLPVIVTPEGCRIYVAAQAALDSEGNIVSAGDVAAQTGRALESLKSALAAAEATLHDLVRVDVHLLSTESVETVRTILAREFPADRAPNLLILPVPDLSPSGALIQISGLAVVPSRSDQSEVMYLNPTDLPNPHGTAPVSIAESRGMVYVSGQSDSAIGRHEPISDMAEITRRSMEALTIALKAAGTSFAEVANSVVYVSSLEQLDKVQQVYKSYFPGGKVPPTSYVPRVQSDSEAGWIEIDMDMVVPQSATAPETNEFINPPELIEPTSYTQVVRAAPGRTVYISAQSSLESTEAESQTQAIYERLQRMLETAGAEFKDAVKVRIFPIGEGGRFVRPVRAKFYNLKAPPASTMIAAEGAPAPGTHLQIDVIAVLPAEGS